MEEQTQTIIADFAARIDQSVAARDSYHFVPLNRRIVIAQFESALDALMSDDYAEAQQRIDVLNALGVQYQLVRYPDPHHEPLIMGFLEYARPGTPQYRGWGGVLARSAGARCRVYQAPHVRSDVHTLEIATRAFVDDPGAAAVVVAGTHRYANGVEPPVADVTRSDDTLFHALTRYLAHTGQNRGTPYWFVQLHGSLDRSAQPMIVISNGTTSPSHADASPLVALKRRLHKQGRLSVGICGWQENDDQIHRLCGTDNIQGLLLEHMGMRSTFVHIELERRLRAEFMANAASEQTAVGELLVALREVLGVPEPPVEDPEPMMGDQFDDGESAKGP